MTENKFEDTSDPLLRRLSPDTWLTNSKISILWGIYLVLGIFFVLLPPVLLVVMSFDSAPYIRIPQGVSLFKYQEMLQSAELLSSFRRSLLLGVSTVFISVPLALLAIFSYLKSRRKSLIIAIILLPAFIPGLIHGVSLQILFNFAGVTNSFVKLLAGHVMWTFPFAFVALLMTVSGIPEESLDASATLGSNEFETVRNVIIPQLSIGILAATIFTVVLSFNEFPRSYYLAGGDNTITTYIYHQIDVNLSPELFAVAGITATLSFLLIGILGIKNIID